MGQRENTPKTQRRIPTLCSTTGFLAVSDGSLLPVVVAICCKLLQTRADGEKCCRMLQTVAICCKTRKSADSASRCVPPIALVDEGANRYRWTRIHRCVAEKQVRI